MILRPTDDLRIERLRPLIPPAILMEQYAITEAASDDDRRGPRGDQPRPARRGRPAPGRRGALLDPRRRGGARVRDAPPGRGRSARRRPPARDARLLREAADDRRLEGAHQRPQARRELRDQRRARAWPGGLLLDLAKMGLPAGCEFLDTITPQFIADLVSWGAIGARTTESQVHRELASGLSMPVGFKNGTDGNVQIAVDAIRAAMHPAPVPLRDEAGAGGHRRDARQRRLPRHPSRRPPAARTTTPRTSSRPRRCSTRAGLPPRIMVDCSHGNSGKDHTRQPAVARDIAAQIADGQRHVFGVMLESHLVGGRQDVAPGPAAHLRAEHHRRLPRLGRHAPGAGRPRQGRARAPGEAACLRGRRASPSRDRSPWSPGRGRGSAARRRWPWPARGPTSRSTTSAPTPPRGSPARCARSDGRRSRFRPTCPRCRRSSAWSRASPRASGGSTSS